MNKGTSFLCNSGAENKEEEIG